MAVLTKMLVVENLGVSAFKVLPQSAKQGLLYEKSLIWTELLNLHQGKRNSIT